MRLLHLSSSIYHSRVWSVPDGNTLYNISLCSPLSTCNGASVCKIEFASKAPTITNIGKRPPLVALAKDGSGLSAIYQQGEKCGTDKTKNYTSEIYFVCGKSLVRYILMQSFVIYAR